MVSRLLEVSLEELSRIVKTSYSFKEVQTALGYRPSSGSVYYKIKHRVEELKLDISHFGSMRSERLSSNSQIYSMDEILIKDSFYTNISRMKKRILRDKLLEYKCHECGNIGSWNNKPMTLQLDHFNGDPKNHRLENLRFICPNCHSQTHNFSGRNKMVK